MGTLAHLVFWQKTKQNKTKTRVTASGKVVFLYGQLSAG